MVDQQARKRRTFRKFESSAPRALGRDSERKKHRGSWKSSRVRSAAERKQRIRQMRGEVIAALETRGWGIDEFVEKGMIPLLQAKKTIFAQHEGIFTDKREVDVEHSGAVVHVLTEAEKREAAETVKRLMAYDS